MAMNSEILQIASLSLTVSVASTLLATLFGLPLGIFLGLSSQRGIGIGRSIVSTFTGLPPVVVGLFVYILLSASGPLGNLRLLFTPTAMVLAQIIIVMPIIAAVVFPAVNTVSEEISETCRGLNLSKGKTFKLLMSECRFVMLAAILQGFGRAVSEVGAVMLVGGNIRFSTRVLTTAIVLETSKGEYANSLSLAAILIGVSLVINLFAGRYREAGR